jgi:hypothetical protein
MRIEEWRDPKKVVDLSGYRREIERILSHSVEKASHLQLTPILLSISLFRDHLRPVKRAIPETIHASDVFSKNWFRLASR